MAPIRFQLLVDSHSMRKLALHASALSDREYNFFTTCLREIADDDQTPTNKITTESDDAHFEQMLVSVREARAWFRGRYSRVSAAVVDGILKLFSPNLGRTDVLTGTEFFAALRLITHAENGKEIDRSLAFVQVDPFINRLADQPPSPSQSSTEFVPASSIAPSFASDSLINSPFPLQADSLQTLYHPLAESTIVQNATFNPFVHGHSLSDHSNTTKLPPLPPRKPVPSTSSSPAPPPPPRHVAARTNRLERSISPSRTPISSNSVPPIPPKPSQHVTSTLMKQSLQASKVAQSIKKAEEQLERERVMQVLKSSSVVSGAYPLAGASVVGSSVVIGTNIHNQHQHQFPGSGYSGGGDKPSNPKRGPKYFSSSISSGSEGGHRQVPPLPKRSGGPAPPSQQPSPPLSDSSLEQVALASSFPKPGISRHDAANSQFRSSVSLNPFNYEDSVHYPLPAPPPMHPDRNPTFGYQQLQPSVTELTLDPHLRPKTQNLETFEAIYGSIPSLPVSPSLPTHGGPALASKTAPSASFLPKTDPPDKSYLQTTTRTSRSQSLSQQSPSLPPLLPPPMRKKRPEGSQHQGSTSDTPFGTASISGHSSLSGPGAIGHRKSSLSLSSTSSFLSQTSSPFTDEQKSRRSNSMVSTNGGPSTGAMTSNIQRTIDALHSIHGQLQPKLEKARYKAEAGFSRRGYVRTTMRSSGEDSPTAVDSEDQESLTRGYDIRKARGRWRDAPASEGNLNERAEVDDNNDELSNPDRENRWERRRTGKYPVHLDNSLPNPQQHHPRHVFDDSPERAEDVFNRLDVKSQGTSWKTG